MIASFDLTGRRALITGAGSPTGIGFTTAMLLGQMGASVLITATTDRVQDRVAQLRADGIDASGAIADLTHEDQVAALPDEWDVLVNNAGMISVGGHFEDGSLTQMSLATWRAGLQRNLDTAFLVSSARPARHGCARMGAGRERRKRDGSGDGHA